MDNQMLKEIQELKEMLRGLQQRVADLEWKARRAPAAAASSAPGASPAPAPAIPARPPETVTPRVAPSPAASVARPVDSAPASTPQCQTHAGQPIQWRCAQCQAPLCGRCDAVAFQGRVSCQTCNVSAHRVVPRAATETDRETFETKFGRYWLNRIGIGSLVLGVAFFLLYTFQYLGPLMKIAMGFAIAGGLLGTGVWLERHPSLRWYGRGLIGGGWALLYFTTYAMHHLPAVRILESRWVDFVLLLAIAAGAVRHSLRYRSETITALALLLGFITTSISDVTYFTLGSALLLTGALAWLVIRMRWHGLYLYGVVASYATFLLWINPHIHLSRMVAIHVANVAQATFWLQAGFVALYWATYTAVGFALSEREAASRSRLLTATLVNALCVVCFLLMAMDPVYRAFRWMLLLGLGATYLCLAPMARQRELGAVATAYVLLGLSLMTLAWSLKLSGRWVAALWTVEVPTLIWLGLRYSRWTYRTFAMGLAVLVYAQLLFTMGWPGASVAVWHWQVPWRLWIGSIGIASFGVAATCYRAQRFAKELRPNESQAFYVYFLAAATLLWLVTMLEANTQWLYALLAAESAATVILGFWLADAVIRMVGAFGFSLIGLMLLSETGHWPLWPVATVISMLYSMNALYRLEPAGARPSSGERFIRHGYSLLASLLLTLLLRAEVNSEWLAVAWGAESLALLVLGMGLNDATLRLCGVGVGVLLAGLLGCDVFSGWDHWRVATTSIVIAMWYASWGLYRWQPADRLTAIEQGLASAYAVAASLTLTFLLWLRVPHQWLALSWAMEGLGLVAIGFLQRDRIMRLSGLAVFVCLVLKILFVDLAAAETIYRILSFIAAGVVLLLASFAYAKYASGGSKDARDP